MARLSALRRLPQAARPVAWSIDCVHANSLTSVAPAPKGNHALVTLEGPGVFLGAAVTKQGGTNDLTFVILDIDGRKGAPTYLSS